MQETAKGRVSWVLSSVLFGGPGLFVGEEVGQEGCPPQCLTIKGHPLSILACRRVLSVQLGWELTGRKDKALPPRGRSLYHPQGKRWGGRTPGLAASLPPLPPPGSSGKPGLQAAQVDSVSSRTKSGVETEAQIGDGTCPKPYSQASQPWKLRQYLTAACSLFLQASPPGVCTWEGGGFAAH